MAVYKLFVVFGVFIHAAISSQIIKELKDAIAQIKNETDHVQLSNQELMNKIKDQADKFDADFLKLKGIEESDNEELKKVMEKVKEVQLKLRFLTFVKDVLVNVTIPTERLNLLKVEYGLKWLRQDLAFLQNRSSNGDQLECFRLLKEDSREQYNGTLKLKQRIMMSLNVEDGDIEVLKLELGQADTALKKAQRANDQLSLKLTTDQSVFEETLNNIKALIEDTGNDLEKAKAVERKFSEEFDILANDVSILKKEYEELVKKEEGLRTEADEVGHDFNLYDKAVKCYTKLELFAGGDENAGIW